MFLKNKNSIIKSGGSIFLLLVLLVSVVSQVAFAEKYSFVYDYRKLLSPAEIVSLSEQEVEERLPKEVSKYIDRAPDVFEFDNNLIRTVDQRILLLSLIKLNYLFDKYNGFTKEFISYKRKNQSKFKIQDKSDNMHVIDINFNAISFLPGNLGGYEEYITFNNLDSILGFYSSGDVAYWLSKYVTHEFGYLMKLYFVLQNPNEFCEALLKVKNAKSEIKKAEDKLKQAECELEDSRRKLYDATNFCMRLSKDREEHFGGFDNEPKKKRIKIEILKLQDENKIKEDILNSLNSSAMHIEKYGDVSPLEIFAAAFVNLECTENPADVNEIGRSLEDYLTKIAYLPRRLLREKSKFNK